MKSTLSFSLVIPVYNECESVAPLYEEIIQTLGEHDLEIIWVDDGSLDDTPIELSKLAKKDNRVTNLRLLCNSGKSSAYMAGFSVAKKDWVVTMDGDLQDDPKEVIRLLEQTSKEHPLVMGYKQGGKSSAFQYILSRFFNTILAWISGYKLKDMNCPMKAMSLDIAKGIRLYGDNYRYFPILSGVSPKKIIQIPIKNRARLHGKSKFGYGKYIRSLFDVISLALTQRYFFRPMQFFGKLGAIPLVIGLGINLYKVVGYFRGTNIIDNNIPTLLFAVSLIIVGTLFIALGLTAEMFLYSLAQKDSSLLFKVEKKED